VNVDVLLPGWPPSPPGRPGGAASKPPGFVARGLGNAVTPPCCLASRLHFVSSRLSSPVLATL